MGGRQAGSSAFLPPQTSCFNALHTRANTISVFLLQTLPGLQDCQELTDVERAIEIVINNFHCYAVKGRKECLTPNELKDLVGQRLPHLAKVSRTPGSSEGRLVVTSEGLCVSPGCVLLPHLKARD